MHFVDPSAAVAVYTDRQTDTHTNTLPYTSLAHAHRGIIINVAFYVDSLSFVYRSIINMKYVMRTLRSSTEKFKKRRPDWKTGLE